MTDHNPRYQYDCARCKFSWTCGFTCMCTLRGMEHPPRSVQLKINAALRAEGLALEVKFG